MKQRRPLVSSDFYLPVFCNSVMNLSPGEVAQAVSSELTNVRFNHRVDCGNDKYREGSAEMIYLQDLDALLKLMLNGTLPENSSRDFMKEVAPLMRSILLKYQIGDLQKSQFE